MPDSETSSRPVPDAQDPPARFAGPCEVQVLLPLPLAGAYDYRVPEGMTLQTGDFVVVPLGRREELGVVWGAGTG